MYTERQKKLRVLESREGQGAGAAFWGNGTGLHALLLVAQGSSPCCRRTYCPVPHILSRDSTSSPTLVSFQNGPCLLPNSVWMDFCFLQNSSTETMKIPWLSLCDTGFHGFFFPFKRAFFQGKGKEYYLNKYLKHTHPVKGRKNTSSLRFPPKILPHA